MTMVDRPNDTVGTSLVSFGHHRAAAQFKPLFAEGMTLVEEVAAYLDGPGRLAAKLLQRSVAGAYAAESMRLTSRLMQIASWLLVQKAVLDKTPDASGSALKRNKVQLTSCGIASPAAVFAQLPEALQDLTARSLQLQARLIQIEAQLASSDPEPAASSRLGVLGQWDLLRQNFDGARLR